MGCGGSTARASTPVDVRTNQHQNENGRSGSAPVNGTLAVKQERDLHSASTVVLGSSKSNTNLNNNTAPTTNAANVTTDNHLNSSSTVQVGQVVRTSISSDSVFIRDPQTPQTQESTVESQVSDTQTQESTVESPAEEETPNKLQECTVENNVTDDEKYTRDEVSQEKITAVGDGEDKVEENGGIRPPSSSSRNEVDECNSVTQLPKVIVRKSINAAVNRLSYQKDAEDDNDIDGEETKDTETVENVQKSQINGSTGEEPEQAKDEEKTSRGENGITELEEQTVEQLPATNSQSEVEQAKDKVPPSTPPNSTIDEIESSHYDENSHTTGVNNVTDANIVAEDEVKFKVGDDNDTETTSTDQTGDKTEHN